MLRRIAGGLMLALGLWLGWGALQAMLLYSKYGASIADYFLDPQTGIISIFRVSAASLMILGGVLTALNTKFSGLASMIGSALLLLIGVALLAAGTDQSLWMTELMFGLAAVALAVLILTLRRA